MATLIPPLNSCSSKMTSGEKRFGQRLKDLLPDNVLCWYDIPVGQKRVRPDFIILMPGHGLLVLEIKDWIPKNIKECTTQRVTIVTKKGLKTVAHPLEQARQYIFPITRILEADPKLKQTKTTYNGKLCFPYSYGAVLSNITRPQLHTMMDDEARQQILPDRYLICKDEITASINAENFQQHLIAMFNYKFGKVLVADQIDRIRWHLFPEVRINHIQEDLFNVAEDTDEVPSALSKLMPDIVRLMDMQQEQLARGLGEGHRVVHGVAGSGKTIILYHRCMYLAEFLPEPILVLCFNITLAKKIRAEIKQRGIARKVQVHHFHGWCKQQLEKHAVELIDNDGEVWDRQVESVTQAVEQGKIPKHQYGAVLIDEGHDFEPEWLRLVTQMINAENPSLLLLYDDVQSIYKKKSSLKFSLSSVGIKAQGRTSILKINYRNTRQILEFAYRFAKPNFFAESQETDIPLLKPETGGNVGDEPEVKNCLNLDAEIEHALGYVKKWSEQEKDLSNIAILYADKTSGEQMAKALEDNQVCHQFVSTQESKKRYSPNKNSISLMPIPSSKGLEFDVVFIINATHVRRARKKDTTDDNIQDAIRLLYVAMTRARNNLFISYHSHNKIADLLHEK